LLPSAACHGDGYISSGCGDEENGLLRLKLLENYHVRPIVYLPLVLLSAPAMAEGTVQPAAVSPAAGDADEGGDTIQLDNSQIVVIATRMVGQVDTPQAPIVTLNEEDIAAYGASSLSDLITALSPQTGSGRGRGSGGPVLLVNGQRISNFREMRNIPPEAIRRMEILPEEVALRYGYSANQRVINMILKDHFASKSVDAEFNAPTHGGFSESEFETTLLKIDKTSRFNLNAKAENGSMLTEAERGVIQSPGTVSTVAGDPDPSLSRSLVADTRDLSMTASWTKGLGSDGKAGTFNLNGQISRNDSRSLSGLDAVVLTSPSGATALRTLGDPLTRTSQTATVQGGAALNKPLGGWQLSATLDGSHAHTQSLIDRRADTSALVTAARAGTLSITGALPVVADPGADLAVTSNDSLTSLVTLMGRPFRLPAGEVVTTLKAGFAYTGIESQDTRSAAGVTSLHRGDLSGGINIGLPITSRTDNVLAGLGTITLNFSAGMDHLSDFGTLKDWSAGVTWSPFEKLNLQASYISNEAAPSLGNLGNPLIVTFNVPVYDFSRGETALVTVTGGGNRLLRKETQRDLKLSATWEVPFLKNSNFIAEYFRNRSNDVTASFPLLTPAIEAAFAGRVVRDSSGRLVSIDRRAVTFSETTGSRIRYGLNLSGTIGKAPVGGRPGMMAGMGGRPSGGAGGAPGGGGGGSRVGGGGGPPMGAMMGMMGGGGQGRWNISLYHTVRFSEGVVVAAGGPVLDLLNGDALSGGGVTRHVLEMEGGAFYKGFGFRLGGNWNAPTMVRASGVPGSSDLRFGSVFKLDLRTFIDFNQQKNLVEKMPFLKGVRLSFVADNILDSRQRVTDGSGIVPISYQADYIDPRGRFLGVDFRKVF